MWEDFVNMAQSHHPKLTKSQVEATLISMRNRAIQSNMPFVEPVVDVTDLEFASGEIKGKYKPDSLHSDPSKEHYEEVMFDDQGASIAAFPPLTSFLGASNPSSS